VVNAPIFHVNADCVDDVCRVFKIAAEYRQIHGSDVVIDVIGYRRMGHNELDQPSFTQPLMYKKIATHPKVDQIYTKQLLDEGVLD
jgi:2-oxoglutarate dehydrogenase E1 component